MPGRFTSDTNSRCLLVSRSIWTTTMVDTCYPVVELTGTASVLGIASFSSSGGTFAAAAPRATDGIILNQTVASGIDNVLTFDVVELEESDEEGVLVTVLETIDNVPYVIGGGRLRQGKDQRINFRATGNNIQVVLNGPYTNLVLAQVCTRYVRSTAQTYLVEVCDESKDRYRFGFNGMEKDNELKGVGNSLDFRFRTYDSRLGKFLSVDPLARRYPWNSAYAFAENDVIRSIDLEGMEKVIVTTNGMTSNEYLYSRKMMLNPNLDQWSKGEYGYADTYDPSKINITNDPQVERDKVWHDKLLEPRNVEIFRIQRNGTQAQGTSTTATTAISIQSKASKS